MIFEWARFNQNVQQEGESAKQHITALYNLVEFCKYGTMKSKLIRDFPIVTICNIGLSEYLQADEKLTLNETIEIRKQFTDSRSSFKVMPKGAPSV